MPTPIRTIAFGFNNCKQILNNLVLEKEIILCSHITHSNDPSEINVNDLIFHSNSHHYTYDMPLHLYEQFQQKYFILFLANMGRIDSYTGDHTTYSDAIYLFRHITCFLYDLLIKESIQLILMNVIPHQVVDVLLESLGHTLNIQTRICVTPSYQNEYFFCLKRSDEYGLFQNKKPLREMTSTPVDRFIINSSTHKKDSEWITLTNFLRKSFFKRIRTSPPTAFLNLSLYNKYMENQKKRAIQKELPENFVYFPLHYQPEASTIGIAPILYDDQVLCIEYLAQNLPDNYVILLKEQPIQLFYYRNDLFYKRLKNIPQVRFVANNEDSHTLIQKSCFVATITGTAGWEALKYGKPVVYFGHPTYREMPGAFAFTQKLNLHEVINYKIDQQALNHAFGTMCSSMHKGTLVGDGTNIKENITLCTHELTSIIRQIKNEYPEYINENKIYMTELARTTVKKDTITPHNLIPQNTAQLNKARRPFWKRAIFKILHYIDCWLIIIRFWLSDKKNI